MAYSEAERFVVLWSLAVEYVAGGDEMPYGAFNRAAGMVDCKYDTAKAWWDDMPADDKGKLLEAAAGAWETLRQKARGSALIVVDRLTKMAMLEDDTTKVSTALQALLKAAGLDDDKTAALAEWRGIVEKVPLSGPLPKPPKLKAVKE